MEPYIGQIILFAGNFVPMGWALCNGATIHIKKNEALFSLLGTTYGGDGTTSFHLPNMKGLASGAAEINYLIAIKGFYPNRG